MRGGKRANNLHVHAANCENDGRHGGKIARQSQSINKHVGRPHTRVRARVRAGKFKFIFCQHKYYAVCFVKHGMRCGIEGGILASV